MKKEINLSFPAHCSKCGQAKYLPRLALGLEEKLNEIEAYCLEHPKLMWAAKIWGIINGKDFKEIPQPTAHQAVKDE